MLFIIAGAVIVWLLPREGRDGYTYEMGKPWAYSLLTAPIDMPIYLDTISEHKLKDSIEASFIPVYMHDIDVRNKAITNLTNSINSTAGITLSLTEKRHLIATVNNLYEDGIVDADTYKDVSSGLLPNVRFIQNNTAVLVPTARFLSARTAYARLDSILANDNFRKAIKLSHLSEYIVPNIKLDSIASKRLHDDAVQKAMAPIGVIQKGERIIDKGDIVSPQLYRLLQTYDEISSHRSVMKVDKHHYPIVGQSLYVIILLTVLYCYFHFFRRRIFQSMRSMVFIMLLLCAFQIMAFIMHDTFRNGLYLMPFTVVPIIMVIFFDGRSAFFMHVAQVLLCSMVATFPLEFIFLQLVAGTAAINSLKELTRRSQLVATALWVLLAYSISYATLEIVQLGTLDKISWRMFGCFGLNAVLISFTYVLVFVLEKIFGFVSSVTLVELSDINNPVLRELSEECPGTFQHSMQLSNLASEAAHRIGANVQLVRTGALYHDIGKINNPAFFTENQHGVNPHDSLSPQQSARVVISHVSDGLKRAEKAKLPQMIRNFITEHHGLGKAKYFYTTYCNTHPNEEVDEQLFTYPGPNPRSRETSILMMADAVEAASRSLPEHSPEAISSLVNRIIDGQIADGLHNDSTISFHDVKIIKEAFIERLRTMYHARVSYPTLNSVSK